MSRSTCHDASQHNAVVEYSGPGHQMRIWPSRLIAAGRHHMSSRSFVRRAAAAVAGTAVVASGLMVAGPAPAAHAETVASPQAKAAATWLAGRLTNGALSGAYDGGSGAISYTDWGTSVEAAYALRAVGGHDAAVSSIGDRITADLASYTTGADFGDAGDIYAGSSGKALALLADLNRAVTNVNGVDLKARVESTVATSAPIVGRIQDQFGPEVPAWGDTDYANVFGQAWAVRGLLDTNSSKAATALSYLLKQQCAAGFFRLYLPSASVTDQTCDGASPAETVPAVDTAALVIVLLNDFRGANPTLDQALTKAADWIKTRQAADGSFDGGTAVEGANANSTGLAGWALNVSGEKETAAKAAVWLRNRQVVGPCDGALASQAGALGYDDETLTKGRKSGIGALEAGKWQTAAAQALPALLALPATSPKTVSAARFVKAGTSVTVQAGGLTSGEPACLQVAGAIQRISGAGSTSFQIPAGTGTHVVTLTTAGGRVTTTVVGLAKAKLKVKVAARIKAGRKAAVKVKGLAAGESVHVKIGKRKLEGVADANGVFKSRIKVAKRKGVAVVRVTGEFGNRKGRADTRIV